MSSARDLFLFDSEQLHALADAETVRRGLAWFKENRVTGVDHDEAHLWAAVEDENGDVPNSEVWFDADGEMHIRCDCGGNQHQVCAHVVAALYAHANHTSEQALLGATETAIEWRVKRGRTEVEVEPLGDTLWFGAWKAGSITTDKLFSHTYRVNIRSLEQRSNYCTCPDFATNQLGTCKHIEGVLHKLSKRRDYAKLKKQPAPIPYVYLNWDAPQPPQITLHSTAGMDAGLRKLCDQYFDATGNFAQPLPDSFFRFAGEVQDRADIDVGEDAQGYARRLAERASQQMRAQDIHAQITASGGHLPGIKAKLYPYQVEGVAFLAANGRALLADDMGLGKTLQAISAASWLYRTAQAKKVLIVCPASLKQQWAREIEKFSGHQAHIIQGSPEARGVQYRRGDGFYILNYELVLRDLSVINSILSPDLLILDEAQRIKNWQTKIATAVKRVESRYAFVLSGTPLENRLEDLYSLMQVVDPHVLGPLWRYFADFHITDERGKVLGYRNLSALRQRLAPVMLRRDRRLVSDQLPRRIEQRLDVAMTQAQLELHDAAMQAAGSLARLMKRRPLTPSEQNRFMSSLQQARMACNAAGLVDKETEGSPKLDELENIISELCVQSGLKAVVFSQWELMTQMVEERLRRMGVGCVRLHGGVPTAKRGDLMDRFRDDDAIQVFISTDAGGTGLNLQNAAVLVNLDMPWNPAVLDQRIARIHRLGQKEVVQIVLMVASDSYEERVMALVKGKRHLFDNVIDPDASEDVVGVSRKLLDVLSEELAGAEPETVAPAKPEAETEVMAEAVAELPEEPTASAEVTAAEPAKPYKAPSDDGVEDSLRTCILNIQQHFGKRVERILGSGGGLLVVLDQVSDADDQQAAQLGGEIPVALLDPRTLRSLQRLGAASPVKDATPYYDAEEAGEAEPPVSRLLALAQQKLQAAEVLLEQGMTGVPAELLVSALLNAAAARGGLEQAPAAAEAGVWVYAQALPNGWLDQEQAGTVIRALALTQSPLLPEALLEQLLDDVHGFMGMVAA
ncbi:MAG: DEAD/DEAH box helicase [Gammaproteobacteria bacterium]|nr:DEAD/DEAH box helicase [Gammaproteobacteria bacterium]MBU1722891.1 DEAD/DEAH box helicase [Gammaproteobacteria bacterium]MBU2005732.1 DEAD/DEAH box helicase [Gammaproteobacteria bacterium]